MMMRIHAPHSKNPKTSKITPEIASAWERDWKKRIAKDKTLLGKMLRGEI